MKKVIYKGEERSFNQLVKEKELPYMAIYQRVLNGWTIDEAFDTPVNGAVSKQTDKEYKIKVERAKLSATKYDENNHIRQTGRIQNFVQDLREQWDKLPLLEVKRKTNSYKAKQKKDVIMMSDLHFGADFVTPFNTYNESVFLERLERLFEYIVFEELDEIVIVNTGDIIQNILRMTDLKVNQFTVVESVIKLCRYLGEWLNRLSQYCKVKYYNVGVANHSEIRFLNAKAGSFAQESVEYILVAYLKDVLSENDRVFINEEFIEDTVQFKIFDKNIIAVHGHQISQKKADDVIGAYYQKYNKDFQTVLMGHYHNSNLKTVGVNKHVVTCGSFVGVCPYARAINKQSSPEALHLVFSPNGLKTMSIIDLQ
ncbi:MAG: hypothetical protein ACRC28_18605 [Clostridium sp.]|uniref:hypothetical protein n=1 Tax=Clostridium sp. TaxID=1506 RepID=UPI003F3A7F00